MCKNSIIVKSIAYCCFIGGRDCWDHLVLIYYTERKIKCRCLVAMSTIPTKELRYMGSIRPHNVLNTKLSVEYRAVPS